ncbi:MAG: diacylglycerol kinase [Bdellovibrionales bacterium]
MTTPPHKAASLLEKTKVAWNGLRALLQERAAQYELAFLLLTFCLYLKTPSPYSFTATVLAFLLLAIEAMNTSLEKLCDHVTPHHHEEIKIIKDCASSSIFLVALASIFALIVHFTTLIEEIAYVS